MGKKTTLALVAAGLLTAGWSGAWVYGKGAVQTNLDAHIAQLAEQGVMIQYQDIQIDGFPLGYRGRITRPRYQAPFHSAQGLGQVNWQAEWAHFDATVADFGVITLTLPDVQEARFFPAVGVPPLDVAVESKGLIVRLGRDLSHELIGLRADSVLLKGRPQVGTPYAVSAENIVMSFKIPANRASGQVDLSATLQDVVIDEQFWSRLDPAGIFPRAPGQLSITASAETVENVDGPAQITHVKLDNLIVDAAGIRVAGAGQAAIKENQPEGTFDIRLSGLDEFMNRIVRAGFVPAGQMSFARMMLSGFSQENTGAGGSVYQIAFRNGATYVNGKPTFLPAPKIPK